VTAVPARPTKPAAETPEPALVAVLVCPESGQPLAAADGALVADLNARAARRELVARSGRPIEQPLEAGLLRADGSVLFPVVGGVPDLFASDGIELTATSGRMPALGSSPPETGFDPERLARLAGLEQWHFWFAARRELVRRLLRTRLAPSHQLVLDVGCGPGGTVALLGELGHRAIGLDVHSESLQAVRRAHPGSWVVQADGAALPFASETFDGVTIMDVLEHVDDSAFATEVERVTKPGGWLLVTVPAMPWLWSYQDEVAGHRRRYTRRSVRRLLEAQGFEVRSLIPYQFFLFPLVVGARLLGRRRESVRERELDIPPRVNRLLGAIARAEVAAGRVVTWPFGSSLVALCEKPRR
jgi:SAM-dependent methyltransferase